MRRYETMSFPDGVAEEEAQPEAPPLAVPPLNMSDPCAGGELRANDFREDLP